jgi:hypothetical protein
LDLTPVLNKPGATLPDIGDTIVFHGGDSGHVAIVSGRETSSSGAVTGIDIVEQNFSNSGMHTLAVLSDGTIGDYVIVKGVQMTSKTRGGYTIVGWLHPTKSLSPLSPAPIIGKLVTDPSPTMIGSFNIIATNGTNIDPSSVFLYMTGPPGSTAPQCTAASGQYTCYVENTKLDVKTPTAVTATIPIFNQGYYNVYLQNGAKGIPSLPWQLEVQAPVPSITSIVPPSLPIASSGQTVSVNGNGFTPNAALEFNNQPHTATYVSPNQMTMLTTYADVSSASNYPITVINPAPGGGSSKVAYLVIKAAASPILSLSTSSITFGNYNQGTASSPIGLTVKNTGEGSLAVPSISLGGMNASDFSESNGCVGSLSPSSTCLIQVGFTPSGIGSRVATMTIASTGATGSPATVSLSGTGTSNGVQITATISPQSPILFGTSVLISGKASPGAVVTATETVPDGTKTTYVQKAADSFGNWTDGKFTPKYSGMYREDFTDNVGDTATTLKFMVNALPTPFIGSLTPTQLTHSNADQKLVIKGTGFIDGLTVNVIFPDKGSSTLSGSQAIVKSDGEIDCLITLGNGGMWSVQVKNPDGQSSNAYPFTVN